MRNLWLCPYTYSTLPSRGESKRDKHFLSGCRSKHRVSRPQRYNRRMNEVTLQRDSESSEEEYMYSINSKKGSRKTLKVNGALCDFLLDTGASDNVLDQSTYVKIGSPRLDKRSIPVLLWRRRTIDGVWKLLVTN